MAIDSIAETLGVRIDRLKFLALTAECRIGTEKCLLMKPQTYMNNSGDAIGQAARFYKVPPENVIIIFDDISLEPGKIRIRRKGSSGGHNGLKSIIAHLGSDNFPRVKIGVGDRLNPDKSLADHVLGTFSKSDIKELEQLFPKVFDSVKLIVSNNTGEAMNRYN